MLSSQAWRCERCIVLLAAVSLGQNILRCSGAALESVDLMRRQTRESTKPASIPLGINVDGSFSRLLSRFGHNMYRAREDDKNDGVNVHDGASGQVESDEDE